MAESTPSEVVLFNGERFARRRLVGNVRLLHSGERVAARPLGRAILRAAFLANDEADVVRFRHGEVPTWFGRRSRRTLFVEPGRAAPEWPRLTVEWAVSTFLEELPRGGTGGVPVGALVDSFFDGDQADPWSYVVDLVRDGLVARGCSSAAPSGGSACAPAASSTTSRTGPRSWRPGVRRSASSGCSPPPRRPGRRSGSSSASR